MNKWKIIVPVGAAAAVTAAAFLLTKDKNPAAKTDNAKPQKKSAPVNRAEGHYSFVSGFRDAVTVDTAVSYDPDRFDFSVVEEGFLSYTSDSHAAVMYGSDFNVQIEYVPYYSGDDFEKLTESSKAVHTDCVSVANGFQYVSGDSVCACLPVDDYSYLLVTAMLSKGSELKFEELPAAPELRELLGSIKISFQTDLH